MGIRICLDEVLKKKGMTSKELCKQVGITEAESVAYSEAEKPKVSVCIR